MAFLQRPGRDAELGLHHWLLPAQCHHAAPGDCHGQVRPPQAAPAGQVGVQGSLPTLLGALGSLQPWGDLRGWGWELHRTAEQLWGDFSQHSELLHKGRAWNSVSTLQLCDPCPDGAWRRSRVICESGRVAFSLGWELWPERHKTKMLHHCLQAGELTQG